MTFCMKCVFFSGTETTEVYSYSHNSFPTRRSSALLDLELEKRDDGLRRAPTETAFRCDAETLERFSSTIGAAERSVHAISRMHESKGDGCLIPSLEPGSRLQITRVVPVVVNGQVEPVHRPLKDRKRPRLNSHPYCPARMAASA